MTTRLTPIVFREITTQSEMTDSVRRRTSGFRYWLLMPFAGLIIYAAAIWTALVLTVPSRLVDRLHFRR